MIEFQGFLVVVDSPAPVSYTHLDVYKRQSIPHALSLGQLCLNVHQHLKLLFRYDALLPVSYTHLDVYKRQEKQMAYLELVRMNMERMFIL